MPLERGQLVWLDINHGCSLIQFSCLMKMITVTSLYVGARARANKRTVDSTNTVLLPVLDSLLNIPIGKKNQHCSLTCCTDTTIRFLCQCIENLAIQGKGNELVTWPHLV
jgi:hypothetical protein